MKSSFPLYARPLIDALLRQPLGSLRQSLRAPDRASLRNRRLRILCDAADLLGVRRPRGWRARRQRLYQHVLARASAMSGDGPAPGGVSEESLPWLARAALRKAPSPLRESLKAAASLGLVITGSLSLVGLLLALAVPAVRHWAFPPNLAAEAHWVASSAFPGTSLQGTKAESSAAFFVHTDFQDNPTVILDFGHDVSIGEVHVRNRTDCCQERTLPLNVEVPDGAGWRLICQRRAPFSSWGCQPSGVRTRLLRLRVPGHTALHLKSVEVFR